MKKLLLCTTILIFWTLPAIALEGAVSYSTQETYDSAETELLLNAILCVLSAGIAAQGSYLMGIWHSDKKAYGILGGMGCCFTLVSLLMMVMLFPEYISVMFMLWLVITTILFLVGKYRIKLKIEKEPTEVENDKEL